MGGYNPNPPPDSDAPAKTALEAEAIAGQAVGYRGSYGGEQGRAAQNYDILQRNKQAAAQAQQQQVQTSQQRDMAFSPERKDMSGDFSQQQQTSFEMVRQQAIIDSIQSRPRYMDIGAFGDSSTQAALAALPEGANKDAELGRILEEQRKKAEMTPGKTDDRYFENQLSLWNAQKIERTGGYSSWAQKTGKQQNANPFENVGDIALSFEKAGNVKDNFGKNYAFNPNVGTLIGLLPNGKGLQEYDWDVAKSNEKGSVPPAPVSWMPAIEYINSQHGKYGVYGELYGGVRDTNTPTPPTNANRIAWETPLNAQQSVPIGNALLAWNREQRPETVIVPPTGEIDVFGNKVVIPGLAFFQQPTIKETRQLPSYDERTPFATAFGDKFQFKAATDINKLEAAPWVPSKGEVAVGSPEYSLPVAVGAPIVTTRFNPETGMTETVSEQKYSQEATQKYETWDMTKQTVAPTVTTFTAGKSGLDNLNDFVSDKYIKPYTPTPEEATRSGYAFFGKYTDESRTSFEKNAPYGAAGVKFFTEGFYGGARDKPVTAGASLAVGFGLGAIFRGASALTPVVERVAGPTVTKALTFTGGKVLPVALTGLYGVDVASRSTEGFTNYEPSYVSKNLGAITSTEIMPGFIGFGAGSRAVSGGVRVAGETRLDYLSMKQEAQSQNLANIPTMGRPGLGEIKYTPLDYFSFKTGKFVVETQGRGAIFGENVMNAYVKAKVTGIPDIQVAAENGVYTLYGKAYQALGYGDYSPSLPTPKLSVPVSPKSAQPSLPKTLPKSRMGTKTVGGSRVGGLQPERSLKSMGITEPTGSSKSSGGVSIGQRSDFRNAPRGSMKPMDNIKQSAILYPMEQPQQIPQQMPQPVSLLPERMSQPSSFDYDILQVQRQDARQGMMSGVIPAFMSAQVLGQRQGQEKLQAQEPMKITEMVRLSGFTHAMRNVQQQGTGIKSKVGQTDDQIYTTVPIQTSGIISGQKLWQDVIQTQAQLTRTTQGQKPVIDTQWTRTITPIVPIIPIIPSFPGGGDIGGRPQRSKKWRNTFNWGLDIASKSMMPRMPRVTIPGVPKGKKRRKR